MPHFQAFSRHGKHSQQSVPGQRECENIVFRPENSGSEQKMSKNPGFSAIIRLTFVLPLSTLPQCCAVSLTGTLVFERNAMADTNAKSKAMTKSAVQQEVAKVTNLTRSQVAQVFDALTGLIKKELGKKGPGLFTVPGLLKLRLVKKPATKARKGINPFTKQETMIKAKPARNIVRARPLKALNDLVK
jgi:nucleoid DNA-binding protein